MHIPSFIFFCTRVMPYFVDTINTYFGNQINIYVHILDRSECGRVSNFGKSVEGFVHFQ